MLSPSITVEPVLSEDLTSLRFVVAVTVTVTSGEFLQPSSLLQILPTFLIVVVPAGKEASSLTTNVTVFDPSAATSPSDQLTELTGVPFGVQVSEQLTNAVWSGIGSLITTSWAMRAPPLVYVSWYSTLAPGDAAVEVANVPLGSSRTFLASD